MIFSLCQRIKLENRDCQVETFVTYLVHLTIIFLLLDKVYLVERMISIETGNVLVRSRKMINFHYYVLRIKSKFVFYCK